MVSEAILWCPYNIIIIVIIITTIIVLEFENTCSLVLHMYSGKVRGSQHWQTL